MSCARRTRALRRASYEPRLQRKQASLEGPFEPCTHRSYDNQPQALIDKPFSGTENGANRRFHDEIDPC